MTKESFLVLRSQLLRRPALLRVVDFFATRVVYAYVAVPFALIWFHSGRAYILAAGSALVLSWGVVVQTIAVFFPRKRPYQEYRFTPLAGRGLFSRVDARHDSFPSGHTTALATLTLVGFLFHWPIALLSAFITIVTATCRVVLGYHFIPDIFAGALIAFGVCAALYSTHILQAFSAFAW